MLHFLLLLLLLQNNILLNNIFLVISSFLFFYLSDQILKVFNNRITVIWHEQNHSCKSLYIKSINSVTRKRSLTSVSIKRLKHNLWTDDVFWRSGSTPSKGSLFLAFAGVCREDFRRDVMHGQRLKDCLMQPGFSSRAIWVLLRRSF